MRELRSCRVVPALLAATLIASSFPAPVRGQDVPVPSEASPAPAQDVNSAASLDEARELIKAGEYDRVVEILKASIVRDRDAVARLGEAYLLLIKTYVFLGNDLKFRPQGREASSLNYQEAKRLIVECLKIPELRHTRPEPASEYPPEMISFFTEIRGQIFGSFRVLEREPKEAVVLLDGDTLRALGDERQVGDVDIAVGPHSVVVSAPGYQDVTEQITISPSATLELSYVLAKRRGSVWYATRVTGALGVVGGLVALLVGRGDSTAAADVPLSGPPPPPSR